MDCSKLKIIITCTDIFTISQGESLYIDIFRNPEVYFLFYTCHDSEGSSRNEFDPLWDVFEWRQIDLTTYYQISGFFLRASIFCYVCKKIKVEKVAFTQIRQIVAD